jgi:hypothetical protein
MHMKIVFLAFLFLITTGIGAQKMDSLVPSVTDTTVNKVEQRVERKMQNDATNSDFRPLLELQKQNEKKQKKGAIIRIAIGVGLLVILIIGLMRRKRKTEE